MSNPFKKLADHAAKGGFARRKSEETISDAEKLYQWMIGDTRAPTLRYRSVFEGLIDEHENDLRDIERRLFGSYLAALAAYAAVRLQHDQKGSRQNARGHSPGTILVLIVPAIDVVDAHRESSQRLAPSECHALIRRAKWYWLGNDEEHERIFRSMSGANAIDDYNVYGVQLRLPQSVATLPRGPAELRTFLDNVLRFATGATLTAKFDEKAIYDLPFSRVG